MTMYSQLESIKGNTTEQTKQRTEETNNKNNSVLRVETPEMMNIFNNFVGNFMNNVSNQQRNNILYGNKNDFVFKCETTYRNGSKMGNNGPMTSSHTTMTFPNMNKSENNVFNMKPLRNSMVKDSNNASYPFNSFNNLRGSKKRIRSPSPVDMQEWKRITELSSDNISQISPSEYIDKIPSSPDPSK